MNNKQKLKYLLILGICAFALCVLAIGGCDLIVKHVASGRIYDAVESIPVRKTGLLLGTVQYTKRGNANRYYLNRIDAAAKLYHAKKISYLLISGDNHKHGYNEPEDMRQSLIAKHVPDSVIYLDYAGFSTYASVVRANKVFEQDSFTIISQYWHNERAIYIARHHGIDAIAFNSDDVRYCKTYLKNHMREVLAKVKAVIDVMRYKQPRYRGKTMSIPGSQSTAFKDSVRKFSYPQNVEPINKN